jgi:cob(I)alamin adenosyltransferase
MANRLTQIATRTGDDGTTGLGDNRRVSKNSLRVHAMGEVDELNSHIGVLLCEDMHLIIFGINFTPGFLQIHKFTLSFKKSRVFL